MSGLKFGTLDQAGAKLLRKARFTCVSDLVGSQQLDSDSPPSDLCPRCADYYISHSAHVHFGMITCAFGSS